MIRRVFVFLIMAIVFTGCSTVDEKDRDESDDYDIVSDTEVELKEQKIIELKSEITELTDRITMLEEEKEQANEAIALHQDVVESTTQWNNNSVYFLGSKRYSELEAPPQNEAVEDESFMRFITEFKNAISDRDVEYIIEHLDGNKLEPHMDSGPDFEEFKRVYELMDDDTENNKFWEIMEEILELGFQDISSEASTAYYAPYFGDYRIVVESWDEFNEFLWGVCTGENVNVRNKPSLDSVIIDQVDYLVLEYGTDQERDSDWIQVVLPDGRIGYIHDDYIHSEFGYRCIFEYKDNKWVMTMLMAGC